MVPMSSMNEFGVDQATQDYVINVARRSIAAEFEGNRYQPSLVHCDPLLVRDGASFVTLYDGESLRGCIGSLEAYRALIVDIADNARSAAFRDPRFLPLGRHELDRLRVEVSILTPAVLMEFDSEAALLAQLVPGVDGLVIEVRGQRGTFLPTVWQQLKTPEQFMRELKRKAGLPSDYWSDELRISRYATYCIREHK